MKSELGTDKIFLSKFLCRCILEFLYGTCLEERIERFRDYKKNSLTTEYYL